MANERMWGHMHVGSQLIDKADYFLHHLLNSHGRSEWLHDPLVKLKKKLLTNVLVGKLHHGKKIRENDGRYRGRAKKIFVRLPTVLHIRICIYILLVTFFGVMIKTNKHLLINSPIEKKEKQISSKTSFVFFSC